MMKLTVRNTLSAALWLAALLLIAWALRAPTLKQTQWNLDEACTFTMAQQIREGAVLYRDAVDHRGPLVPYLKAAVFAVAGDWNVHAVRVTLALAIGLVAFLLRDLARRLGSSFTGGFASVIFLVLSAVFAGTSDSFAAHTEWFVVFFSTIGFWIFAYAYDRGELVRGIAMGAIFGASALCKQPGALDLGVVWVLIGLLVWWRPTERPRLLRLWFGTVVGLAIIGCAAVAYFWQYGALRDFVYYAWRYNVEIYVPEISRWQRLTAIRVPFILAATNAPVLGLLALAGVIGLLRVAIAGHGGRRSVGAVRQTGADEAAPSILPWLILGWSASGLISTVLSGRDFEHYSIQLIPGISLAAGWLLARSFEWIRAQQSHRGLFAAIGVLFLVAVIGFSARDLRSTYRKLPSREQDGWSELARLVQRYSRPADRIFVWGYYPDGYLLSHRLPATRFINANFLTGMVPWTNLDYERDTRYAVVPGAWDTFWRDYAAHPPAVIIDAVTRGYIKYPILAQPKLRDEIIDHFAEVHRSETEPFHIRVLRRLDTAGREIPAQTQLDKNIQLHTRVVNLIPDVVEVTVVAPVRGGEVVLRLGGQIYRRIVLPPEAPVEVTFVVRISDLAAPGAGFVDAVVFDGPRALQSSPINLIPRHALDPQPSTPSPVLHYGNDQLASLEPEQRPWSSEPRSNILGWRIGGPFTLEFPCASEAEVISWIWQPAPLRRGAPEPTQAVIPEISLVSEHGIETLTRNAVIEQNGQYLVTTELPTGPKQRVRLHWEGRKDPDRVSEEVWIAALKAFVHGPVLNFDEREILPIEKSATEDRPWTLSSDGSWSAPAPSRIVYPRVFNLNSFVFDYGINDRVYDNPPPGAGEGVMVEVNFLHADGRSENLLSEAIRPKADPNSRGRHHARIGLPEKSAGKIEIKFAPLSVANPVGAESYLHSLRAQGAGPDLVISDRRVLIPVESLARGIEPIHTYVNGRWIAHAPGHVVYPCPADLRAVNFGFGIEEGAYHAEDGSMRTNGVDIIVEFRDDSEKSVELFHRYLDPYHNAGDRGVQHGRIELPGRWGRIVFHIGPGPFNDASYDWSYWTDFTGEVSSQKPSH